MSEERHAKTKYFKSPAEFRRWLEKNHGKAEEVYVGYFRTSLGKKSITWQQSVDEALCFGWIDGVRHSVDEERYTNRFTPRRQTSRWSAINIERIRVLTEEGRMTAAGRAVFESRRSAEKAGYSYESQKDYPFTPAHLKAFKRDKAAWAFFASQAPSYQRLIRFYVESAKQEETRLRRLARTITASRAGKRL